MFLNLPEYKTFKKSDEELSKNIIIKKLTKSYKI